MKRFRSPLLLVTVLLLGAACRTGDDGDSPPATPTMGAGAPAAEATDMQAMAQEGEALAARGRESLAELRDLAPPDAQQRMPVHATLVEEMVDYMERHLVAMEGMHDDDAEHAELRRQIASLREDAALLRGATADRIRQALPEHLDRLEVFVAHVERSATHMRGGHHGMDHGAH